MTYESKYGIGDKLLRLTHDINSKERYVPVMITAVTFYEESHDYDVLMYNEVRRNVDEKALFTKEELEAKKKFASFPEI